jgi:hypothetical protein
MDAEVIQRLVYAVGESPDELNRRAHELVAGCVGHGPPWPDYARDETAAFALVARLRDAGWGFRVAADCATMDDDPRLFHASFWLQVDDEERERRKGTATYSHGYDFRGGSGYTPAEAITRAALATVLPWSMAGESGYGPDSE